MVVSGAPELFSFLHSSKYFFVFIRKFLNHKKLLIVALKEIVITEIVAASKYKHSTPVIRFILSCLI